MPPAEHVRHAIWWLAVTESQEVPNLDMVRRARESFRKALAGPEETSFEVVTRIEGDGWVSTEVNRVWPLNDRTEPLGSSTPSR